MPVAEKLDLLEAFYGTQEATWPTEPYEFLVWWHCGYPASDTACARGWAALKASVGVELEQILGASQAKLAEALKAGGMVPELRALRLQQIAARVRDEFGGDLRGALQGRLSDARKLLKKFPNIADAGADRILLFGQLAPIAAVPSNGPQVLVRMEGGVERVNYTATYRDAQTLLAAAVPERFEARMRAYLLLKRHGQETCKRTKPRCMQCPVRERCGYFARS
jgi:endonuclease-3